MRTHSICFAGLSREEEAEVITYFKQANARTGNHWLVTPETEAEVLVIDMDSMYGQMSLMKALGTGKILVALTASGRADTDYVLQRPVTAEALMELFQLVDSGVVAEPDEQAPEPEPQPVATAEPEWNPPPAAEPTPAIAPAAPAAASAPPRPEPAETASGKITTELPATNFPAPAAAPPADPRLADYLRPGALAGPVLIRQANAPDLVLDPATQTYLGGSALKPLLPHCAAILRESDLEPVSPAELPSLAAALGGTQPWSRLAWLSALAGGNGALAPGYGPNDKYKLLKWPQTEREFPKHFRIATVMMKGPQNLSEIAEQSGSTLAEVIDYVNACLASGVAEPESPAPMAADAGKGGGLLGRFRR